MPGGKTHMAIGIGVGLALSSVLPITVAFPWQLGLTLALTTVGALAPDLDIADNELEELGRNEGRQIARRLQRAGRRQGCVLRLLMGTAGAITWLIGEIISRMLEAIAFLIQQVTTHRGLTHSLIITVLIVAGSVTLSSVLTPDHTRWWGVAWSAGWISHLAADGLTLSGLRLLQPWSDRRFWFAPRLFRFRVGTWPDALLGAIAPIIGLMILLGVHGVFGAIVAALDRS